MHDEVKSVTFPAITIPHCVSHHITSPSIRNLLQNFSFVYLKIGFPRLPAEQQQAFIPEMLELVAVKPLIQQDSYVKFLIFPLLVKLEPAIYRSEV